MIVNSAKDAQIALILVSRTVGQILELRRDLQASRYVYLLLEFSDEPTLRREFAAAVMHVTPNMPLVIVVNFGFVGSGCGRLLSDARDAAGQAAIACVVTDVPEDESLRTDLRRLGAYLFETAGEPLSASIGLH